MARKIIDIGVVGNDGTGDSIRDSFRKVNDNFRELYSSLGLGEKLTFIGMDDTPETYVGQNDPVTFATPLVTVNNDESGLTFKQLRPGEGISIDFVSNPNEITINSEFSRISADDEPQLGGNLSAKSGGQQYRIKDLVTPVTSDEAVNKQYADTKIARAGVNAIDPATGQVNAAFGRMSGPLILARDPEPDDDEVYDGLIAATKRYVDNSAFGSVANLYVATSGADERPGVSKELQGRALAYAYRTIEAACKRAEELILASREEIGPYKKTLTYNDGNNDCYLTAIISSPLSGSGFDADPVMSVDTIRISTDINGDPLGGTNYNIGDRIQLTGGVLAPGGQKAIIEVLSTATTPGTIVTFRIISTGSYLELPGSSQVATSLVDVGSSFGAGATFEVTYKVSAVRINNPGGSASSPSFDDYSLVSVRIEGGGGTGAFGTAYVTSGQITSITVTDQGSGFTSLPTVQADLPRFKIFTDGLRTDATGNVDEDTPQAIRTRDIREGLYLYGVESGALAQILSHNGTLVGDDEVFDVDIKYGAFEVGEAIAYGDVSRNTQITILVESGIYEENLPIKVPQNTSIVGDEFRRCIVRPRPGTSSSPWAFQKFRRDLTNDGLVTASQLFGYHYLTDPTQPVYPKIDNKGYYNAAAALIDLNRAFIQEETIAWIESQIADGVSPFVPFTYNEDKCARDVGLILEAVINDMLLGSTYLSNFAARSYLRSYSVNVTTYQKGQTIAGINEALDQALTYVIESSTYNGTKLNLSNNIEIITDIIQNEVAPTSGIVYTEPTGITTDASYAAAIITANRQFIIDEVTGYINDTLDPGAIPGYDATVCGRDVGYILDALVFDLIYGGNSQAIATASAYYDYAAVSTVTGEESAFTSALTQLQTILPKVISNQTTWTDKSVSNLTTQLITLPAASEVGASASALTSGVDVVIDVVNSGLAAAPSEVEPTFVNGVNYSELNADATTITTNLATIKDSVLSFLNSTYSVPFTYRQNICKRDVGLILDSLIFDLQWGGYNRTISAGLKYYQNASGLLAITTQKAQTLAAIDYAYALVQQVIDNFEITTTYQDLYLQIIDLAYQAESGSDTVIDELIAALKDVMSGAGGVNLPKDNNQMDMFLANDAVRWQAITGQGHGGFMLVLDPEGQILAKSPYAQECASFSKSINAQTFAGGMFIDGFAGNLEFRITAVESTTRLLVDSLDRMPQLPCSFIVEDVVYRVNYIRDFVYNKDGSTATFVLDETTPWPFDLFTYDSDICSRDVGYIIDGLGYDMVLGTNYNQRKAGLTYRGANAEVVILDQKRITVDALEYAHDQASAILDGYATQQAVISNSKDAIVDIIERGALYAPALTFTNPPGLDSMLANAKTLLLDNIEFIKDEVIGYIASTYPSLSYDTVKCSRDTQYIIEALVYDLIYGGNSQTIDSGVKYYSSVISGNPLQIPTGQKAETIDSLNWAKYLAKTVIVNGTPSSLYSATPQATGSASDSTTQGLIETLMSDLVDIIDNGLSAVPGTIDYPSFSTYSYNSTAKTASALLTARKSVVQADVIEFVDYYGNRYEMLMPGNRSILCNDYTQVNDLGYGIFATNGGLVEAVSMFTYYCHISYYSLNGAQIRSVTGSSSHGNYGLVAEGSDPLEVPTPTGLYYDLAQALLCYAPTPSYYNAAGGLFIFVTDYDYLPIGGSELEVDHDGVIYRYPVTSVVTDGMPTGVARLNITSDDTGNFDGLYDQILDGVKMSIRMNSQVYLTGDLAEVAVRPSTGLRLRESEDIYRVLQFDAIEDPNGPYSVNIAAGNPGVFDIRNSIVEITSSSIITTENAHLLKKGQRLISRATSNNLVNNASYYVREILSATSFTISTTPSGSAFTLVDGTGLTIPFTFTHGYLENYTISFTTTGTLPAPLVAGTTYFVSAEGLTETSFRISTQKNGDAMEITTAGSGTHELVPVGITKTTLRENYNFVDFTLYQPGEFVTSGSACTITVGSPTIINAVGHGYTGGETIKFESSDDTFPIGITEASWYFVLADGLTADTFKIAAEPGGIAIDTSDTYTGSITQGEVFGRAGDQTFAVVPVSPSDTSRADGMRFVFKGEEYTISNYESEVDTNKPWGRITLNRPLVDSIISFPATYTIRAGVPARSIEGTGSLTIRISLTRATSHDILEVGTGSYADTNYPNEIYGPSVNPLAPAQETVERGVGRVFYVTTDQFGNFKVGPYFAVDQGTGRVTFSAAIALSNLDGIGFKRGVPIAEFSVDSTFSDNATDTVPTENATRIYIERRLGLTHAGVLVADDQLIPSGSGGFMSLDGQSHMKGNMDLGNNKIVNLADPTDPLDGVNLRSLTFTNLQEFTITSIASADLLTFTGSGNNAINATVVGDLAFTLNESANELNAQIVAGSIINADVNSSAAIAQSKLAMNAATTRANATGIAQADLGLASFDSATFTITNGWVELKTNGTALSKLAQIGPLTLLGNSDSVSTANVSAIPFSSIVNSGLAIKKSQYNTGPATTGVLRRKSLTGYNSDGDYEVIDTSTASSGYTAGDASKLIQRDSSGNFGANVGDLKQLKIDGSVAVDSDGDSNGGYIRFYGMGGSASIIIGSGDAANEKATYYDNDAHVFRPQSGIGYAPITVSTIQATAITTGGNTTSGTITGRWTLTGTSPNESRLQATYSADLAEYYEGDKEYEVGTVLVFGGEKEVTTSNIKNDTRVAGVVSNTAAFAMFEGCPGLKNLVALQGRVPCKVVGKIKKGEILVASGIPGVAMAAVGDVKVGTVVGKSLTDYDSDHIGTIEIAVGRT